MYAAGGLCHASLEAATAHTCAYEFPLAHAAGGVDYLTSCSASSASGLTLTRSGSDASSVTWLQSVAFPSCDWREFPGSASLLSVEDGVLLASAIVGLWLLAFSLRAVRSVLKDHDYGPE